MFAEPACIHYTFKRYTLLKEERKNKNKQVTRFSIMENAATFNQYGFILILLSFACDAVYLFDHKTVAMQHSYCCL